MTIASDKPDARQVRVKVDVKADAPRGEIARNTGGDIEQVVARTDSTSTIAGTVRPSRASNRSAVSPRIHTCLRPASARAWSRRRGSRASPARFR